MDTNKFLDTMLEDFGVKAPKGVSLTVAVKRKDGWSYGEYKNPDVLIAVSRGDDIRLFPVCAEQARQRLSSLQAWFETDGYIVGQYDIIVK
ncbi:MAG: hypothetical protein WC852_00300 [Candidatus Nanoarchaeia archaeon]|jgi:hypothetical protein